MKYTFLFAFVLLGRISNGQKIVLPNKEKRIYFIYNLHLNASFTDVINPNFVKEVSPKVVHFNTLMQGPSLMIQLTRKWNVAAEIGLLIAKRRYSFARTYDPSDMNSYTINAYKSLTFDPFFTITKFISISRLTKLYAGGGMNFSVPGPLANTVNITQNTQTIGSWLQTPRAHFKVGVRQRIGSTGKGLKSIALEATYASPLILYGTSQVDKIAVNDVALGLKSIFLISSKFKGQLPNLCRLGNWPLNFSYSSPSCPFGFSVGRMTWMESLPMP